MRESLENANAVRVQYNTGQTAPIDALLKVDFALNSKQKHCDPPAKCSPPPVRDPTIMSGVEFPGF